MSEKIGIMVCGHGSRDDAAVEEFQSIANGLRKRLPQYDTEWGFLEFARPIIREGLDKLREKGCTRILALQGLLFAAGHAKNDCPARECCFHGSFPYRYRSAHMGFSGDKHIKLWICRHGIFLFFMSLYFYVFDTRHYDADV